MAKIRRAIVVVKAWHTSRFTPAMLKSSSRVFDFLKKEVLNKAETYFSFDESEVDPEVVGSGGFTKILVLPSLPTSDPQRTESIELCLIGIDDPNFYKTHNLERALDGAPSDTTKVLLSHAPQTYIMVEEKGIDLLIAGHTHGGQICLPGGYLIMHDRSAPRRILSGAWREGKLQGYTSRGTGGSGLPVRLNCPAEVTLHTLRRG
jgi:predicted MPP superfamily phosphohydrolase